MNKNIFTTVYKNKDACVICSLKMTQRKANSPAVEIESPLNCVKSTLVKIDTASTTHNFIIHNVQNGCYEDFINSIALCIIKAGIPCNVVIASYLNGSTLLYSPIDDRVEYFYSENLNNEQEFEILKQNCIDKYQSLLEFENSF